MTEVRVRNMEEWVVQALRARARGKGRSLEAELREVLLAEAMRSRLEFAQRAKERMHQLNDQYGVMSDSTPFIRELRDNI
jgi:plasmid stability protein